MLETQLPELAKVQMVEEMLELAKCPAEAKLPQLENGKNIARAGKHQALVRHPIGKLKLMRNPPGNKTWNCSCRKEMQLVNKAAGGGKKSSW